MNQLELLRSRKSELQKMATTFGVKNIRIFGSVAKGNARADSDIDLLIDLDPGRSLLDHAGFLIEAEKILGVSVDAVTTKGLRQKWRDEILKQAIPL